METTSRSSHCERERQRTHWALVRKLLVICILMFAAASTAMGTQTLPDEDLPLLIVCASGCTVLVALIYLVRHRQAKRHPQRHPDLFHLWITSVFWGPLIGVAVAWPLSLGINQHLGVQEAVDYRGPVTEFNSGKRASVTIHDTATQKTVRLPLQREEVATVTLGAEHSRRCYRGSLGIHYRKI